MSGSAMLPRQRIKSIVPIAHASIARNENVLKKSDRFTGRREPASAPVARVGEVATGVRGAAFSELMPLAI